MDDKGVFAVARSIWDDEDFSNEAFTQREAWLWMISAAAWKPIRVRSAAGPITIERGELTFAIRFLADKWLWSKSRVVRFIAMLKKRDMLRDTSRDGAKVYSICKYNDFQVVGLPKRDSKRDNERDTSGTRAGQRRNI